MNLDEEQVCKLEYQFEWSSKKTSEKNKEVENKKDGKNKPAFYSYF